MVKSKKHTALRIILFTLLIIIVGAGSFSLWLSYHYKDVIRQRLPQIVTNGSDSIYHVSYTDISVNIFKQRVTITGLRLWPDTVQAANLRKQHRRIPPTLSTVTIPSLEADGIVWEHLISGHSFDCKNVTVYDLKWQLICTPRPQDSTFARDEKKTPYIQHITSAHVTLVNPNVTYKFHGRRESFTCHMNGGTADVNDWAYHYDEKIDTSVFLYAKNGKVRLDSIVFLKATGRYSIKKPIVDFESGPGSITLKNVALKNMVNRDPKTHIEKEIYNLSFPSTELVGFNWNRLINHNTLAVAAINANEPKIYINYIRAGTTGGNRKGAYPNQLLLQVGMETNIHTVNIDKGHFRYTEVTTKKDEAVIDFSNIHARFTNITNIDSVIANHKSCIIKLEGKYQNKSDVSVTFDLGLTDTTGRFKIDGYVKNLDGKDVSEQAAVFTLVKVTSFHLNKMDIHLEGDETYEKGDFTVLYQDLKISLFKFDTKHREGKHGTLAFLGSALVLYPSNPMPGKDVRKVTTSFARDTTRGFIYLIWQNMFRAAKKTAVREQAIVTLTDGPETQKGEKPKKGFFKRIFGKKKK